MNIKKLKTKFISLYMNIFHRKEMKRQLRQLHKLRMIIKDADDYTDLLLSSEDLKELLFLHKNLWRNGLQNANIGPNKYGMFRTENIETMKDEEVFLGDIYGIRTANIPFWEENKNEPYGVNGFGIDPKKPLYDIIVRQYREHLLSNIKEIKRTAEQDLSKLVYA